MIYFGELLSHVCELEAKNTVETAFDPFVLTSGFVSRDVVSVELLKPSNTDEQRDFLQLPCFEHFVQRSGEAAGGENS